MAKYANPEAGQSEGMYDDAMPNEHSEEPSKPEDKDEHKTYLLPVAIAEGKEFEAGDEIVLRIESVQDDQFVVSYAPAKEQEKEPEHEGMAEPAEAGGEKGGQMGSLYE